MLACGSTTTLPIQRKGFCELATIFMSSNSASGTPLTISAYAAPTVLNTSYRPYKTPGEVSGVANKQIQGLVSLFTNKIPI